MSTTTTETQATETTREITYDIGGWATASGATKVSVILDPTGDAVRVYTFNAIGSGTPMAVWHNRHRVIATVETCTVPEALLAALEEREDAIRAVASLYLGNEWDGSNHVGRWTDASERYAPDLDLEGLPTYWDAAEYFCGDPRSVVAEILECDSLADAVANQVSGAAEQGAVLDRDDAEDAIRGLLQERLEDLDPDEDREIARKIAALIGDPA